MSGGAEAPEAAQPLLRMEGIEKHFVGVTALDGVDFDLRPGEVHAVVGENGAGKSTLMKVLFGAYRPDSGTIHLRGQEVAFSHPRHAQEAGISIIFQEFNLLPDRSVAENIFVGREPRMRIGLVDRDRMVAETRELLSMLELDQAISPNALVSDLPVAQQQMVEVAKALSFRSQVLVMDEPTAALSTAEAETLFDRINLLSSRGVAIVYVTHRLEEVFRLAKRVTVLRDGHRVDTVEASAVDHNRLVSMMVGRELKAYFPPRASETEVGPARIQLTDAGNESLSDVELSARAGEILGIGGLEGAGQRQLAEALFGVQPFERGEYAIDGRPVSIQTPRQAIAHGIGYVTADRKGEGLIMPLSLLDNALLVVRALGRGSRSLLGDPLSRCEELASDLDIRARSLRQEVRTLSGGNQQKVVLARWLAAEAQLLVLHEPTRGIDVGAKAALHRLLRALARADKALILISSDLPELLGMSDRIAVMRDGTIVGHLPGGAPETEVMGLAVGEDTHGHATSESSEVPPARARSGPGPAAAAGAT